MTTRKLLITPGNVIGMKDEFAYYEGHEYALDKVIKALNQIIQLDTGLSTAERCVLINIRTIVKRMTRELPDAV